MSRKKRPYRVTVTYPDRVERVTVQAFDWVEAETIARRACPAGTSYRAVLVDGAA